MLQPSAVRTGLAFSALLLALTAHADERPRQRLVYSVDPGISGCPDGVQLRDQVAARLGYDPFVERGGDGEVLLRISRARAALVGRLEMRDRRAAAGEVATRARELASASGDCEELVASLSVMVAVAIDPLSITRRAGATPAVSPATAPPPPPPPAEAPTGEPTRPAELPVQERRGPSTAPRLRVQTGPSVVFGATPAPDVAVSVGVGARWSAPAFSLSAEGRADLPTSRRADTGGQVSASLLLGMIVPCYHAGIARACLLAGAGALRGVAESATDGQPVTRPYAAIGARAGLELPIRDGIALGAHGDLLAALTRITLKLDDRDVWTTPLMSGAAGVDLVVDF